MLSVAERLEMRSEPKKYLEICQQTEITLNEWENQCTRTPPPPPSPPSPSARQPSVSPLKWK